MQIKHNPPIIILAVDASGGFGKDGTIPWNLPEDLQHFKNVTNGHICIMGRRTYADILDARKQRDAHKRIAEPITEILRGRQSFVITSDATLETPGTTKVAGLGEAYNHIDRNDGRKVFVIGGKRLFTESLAWAREIHMSVLKGPAYNCDVFFPIDVLNKKWKIVSGKETEKAYFVVYNKK
jgi:dihydrofolate reductase